MSERTIRYEIKMSKKGKKAIITVESDEVLLGEDLKVILEHLMFQGSEESFDIQ